MAAAAEHLFSLFTSEEQPSPALLGSMAASLPALRALGLTPYPHTARAWAGGDRRLLGGTSLLHAAEQARSGLPWWGLGLSWQSLTAGGGVLSLHLPASDAPGADWAWCCQVADVCTAAWPWRAGWGLRWAPAGAREGAGTGMPMDAWSIEHPWARLAPWWAVPVPPLPAGALSLMAECGTLQAHPGRSAAPLSWRPVPEADSPPPAEAWLRRWRALPDAAATQWLGRGAPAA